MHAAKINSTAHELQECYCQIRKDDLSSCLLQNNNCLCTAALEKPETQDSHDFQRVLKALSGDARADEFTDCNLTVTEQADVLQVTLP